jgi:hypothetical protein
MMMITSISSVSLTKLLTIGAALALAILIVGGAVAERVQDRAVNDRFFLGDLRDASTIRALHLASGS